MTKVLWEYPLPDESKFTLNLPKGASVMNICKWDNNFSLPSLAVVVNAEEEDGEEVDFVVTQFGEEIPESHEFLGQIAGTNFLWMSSIRRAVAKEVENAAS